ncbi:MAG: AAA family ATPase [Saprospiraceae bacterium]|nr:AAA family ATPase [Saprospiraceae bacterium]
MKPFRITSLEAHQIGPFGDLKMTFPEKPAGMADKAEVHILTGENGTGKSTLLELLVNGIDSDMERLSAKCRDEKTHFSIKFSEGANTRWQIENGLYAGSEGNEFVRMYIQNKGYSNYKMSFCAFAYSGYRFMERVEIPDLKELSGPYLAQALSFKNSIEPQKIIQWLAITLTKESIAKHDNVDAANRFRRTINSLENAISKIIESPISFKLGYEPFNVIIEVNHERLDFNLLPDGLKSIISWLADLLMRMDRVKWVDDIPVFERNFILFLDEIEVHMHPRWQRKILPAVQGLFPNAQIFISTHSPFVINSVDGAWIHRLVKPNGDSEALEPVLSEDGKSVTQVLEEIFDITERFGVGPEADLKRFYEVRNRLIKDGSEDGKDKEELIQIAKKLQGQSTTLDQIVAMEIRQLNRIKQLEINV